MGQHPAWQYVEEEIRRFNSQRRDALAVAGMTGTPPTPEKWAYERGVLMGMVILHRLVKGEAAKLHKELDERKAE